MPLPLKKIILIISMEPSEGDVAMGTWGQFHQLKWCFQIAAVLSIIEQTHFLNIVQCLFSSTMMLEIVLYPLLIWAVLDYVANCEPFKASYHVGKVAPWVKVVATQAWWTWALFLNPKLKERTDFQKLLSDFYMACVCSPQSNALSDLWAPYTCRYTHAWK